MVRARVKVSGYVRAMARVQVRAIIMFWLLVCNNIFTVHIAQLLITKQTRSNIKLQKYFECMESHTLTHSVLKAVTTICFLQHTHK